MRERREGAEQDDAALAEWLDRQLNALQAGKSTLEPPPTSDGEDLIECLEALELLAPIGSAQILPDAKTQGLVPGAEEDTQANGTPATPRLPRRFGRYELLAELGRGGMGVVYRARQTDLGRLVAVKMILACEFASEEAVRRFYDEARGAARLRHPGIVGILEVGEVEGQHYFAMDYIEGRSLAQLLREGPLEPRRAAQLVAEVARAVDYLHSQGVIHRDLKPANILIDPAGRSHVTDFGLAKLVSEDGPHTRTGTILGTPNYMAPEQAAGRIHEVSFRSDVFSLGAILYELLTGRPPFQAESPLDTLVQVLEGEPTLPRQLNRQVPQELEWICLKALEKGKAARYASAGALAHDLERFLRGDPVDARPSRWWQQLRRWARRQPALASHLGGILVAALVLQVIYLTSGENFDYHVANLAVLGLWAASAAAFQWLVDSSRGASWPRLTWMAADVFLLTLLLFLAPAPYGPLLVGYPLLVVAAGLFSQVRLVLFTTGVSLLSYAVLEILRPEPPLQAHYRYIFAAVVAILGLVVSYQVQRVRALARYYESRQPG